MSLNQARVKSKNTKVAVDIAQFIKGAQIAQMESGKRLQDITGSGCSDCPCRSRDIRNIPATDTCYIQWVNALTDIQNAGGGLNNGVANITRDPWGSPYCLDENERESGPADCRMDSIVSVGPDGTRGTSDDLSYVVPLSKTCP